MSNGADNKLPYDVAVVSSYRTMNTDSDIAEAFHRIFSSRFALVSVCPTAFSMLFKMNKMLLKNYAHHDVRSTKMLNLLHPVCVPGKDKKPDLMQFNNDFCPMVTVVSMLFFAVVVVVVVVMLVMAVLGFDEHLLTSILHNTSENTLTNTK